MHYERIFNTLSQYKVDYLIAGGMAVNLHGVPRFTKDLDILVNPSSTNLSKLIKCLKSLGYRPKIPVSLEEFMNKKNWEKWYKEKGMLAFNLFHPEKHTEQIDLLIHSPIPFDRAKKNRKTIYAEKLRLHLVSVDDLILMKKKAGRERDLADVKSLEKVKLSETK